MDNIEHILDQVVDWAKTATSEEIKARMCNTDNVIFHNIFNEIDVPDC